MLNMSRNKISLEDKSNKYRVDFPGLFGCAAGGWDEDAGVWDTSGDIEESVEKE